MVSYRLSILAWSLYLVLFLLNFVTSVTVPRYAFAHFEDEGNGHYRLAYGKVDQFNPKETSVAVYSTVSPLMGFFVQQMFVKGALPEEFEAYLLGYTETYHLIDHVRAHWQNTWGKLCSSDERKKDCATLKGVLQQQLSYTLSKAYSSHDDVNNQLLLALWQLKGASDAFNGREVDLTAALSHTYLNTLQEDVMGVYLLSVSRDIPDIVSYLNLASLLDDAQRLQMTANVAVKNNVRQKRNLFMVHITRADYSHMLRVFKSYNLPWKYHSTPRKDTVLAGSRAKFSSYPGALTSLDDFYCTNSLIAMRSTNENMFAKINPAIKPNVDGVTLNSRSMKMINETVPSAIRALIALRLENDVHSWSKTFTVFDHYLVSDTWFLYNKMMNRTDNGDISRGATLVVETVGSLTYTKDLAATLNRGILWTQFGIPYFELIAAQLGYPEMKEQFGDYFDRLKSPIGAIIRRDMKTSKSLTDCYSRLRENNFNKDKLSRCSCNPPYSASLAASPRADLNNPSGNYSNLPWLDYRLSGGIDIKAYSTEITNAIIFQSGPTYADTVPFSWSANGLKPPTLQMNSFNNPIYQLNFGPDNVEQNTEDMNFFMTL